jgi:AcrR family transcriptional regulator
VTSSSETPDQQSKKLRGPYAKTAEVRRHILAVCIDAFGTSGFHGATMKDVARRAGISQTGLQHHFPDKADLLVAVMQERAAQESRIVLQAEDLRVISTQPKILADNEQRPGLIQLHSMISTEATSPEHPVHSLYKKRYESLRTELTNEFDTLRALGRLRVETESRILADLFVAVIDGLQVQWLYNPETVNMPEEFQAFLRTIITDETTPGA